MTIDELTPGQRVELMFCGSCELGNHPYTESAWFAGIQGEREDRRAWFQSSSPATPDHSSGTPTGSRVSGRTGPAPNISGSFASSNSEDLIEATTSRGRVETTTSPRTPLPKHQQ